MAGPVFPLTAPATVKPQHPAGTAQGRLTEHTHEDIPHTFWQGQTGFFPFISLWPRINCELVSLALEDTQT